MTDVSKVTDVTNAVSGTGGEFEKTESRKEQFGKTEFGKGKTAGIGGKEWRAALEEKQGAELCRLFAGAHVAICGAGGLGSNIAVTLASAEVMKPLLISLGLKSFIPYIGPVLVVAGVLSVLFGGGGRSEAEAEVVADRENQREQARLQAETQARAELENKCRYMCMNLSDKMKSSVGRLISEVFKILVTPYKEQAFQIRDESGRLVECWENVKSRISELEHLREILRASD